MQKMAESGLPDASAPNRPKKERKNPSRFASPIFKILADADEEAFYVNASILSKSAVFTGMVKAKRKETGPL